MSEIKPAVEKAKGFDKSLKKITHKDIIFYKSKEVLSNFKFLKSPPNRVIIYSTQLYDIWKFRISNPEANKGKSGAFRLFTYFLKDENKFILYKIYPKKDIEKKSNIDNEIKAEIKRLLN